MSLLFESSIRDAMKFWAKLSKRLGSDSRNSKHSWISKIEHRRFHDQMFLNSERKSTSPRLAIVMQGLILKDDDFTLETLKLYRDIFPGCELILSSWDYEDAEYLAQFKDLPVKMVLSKDPENPGVANVNRQIISTMAGLDKARELGADYVLKTRCDQRIYAPNVRDYLLHLLEAFPLAPGTPMRSRLVATSMNTFKYRPYSVSDMFLFGALDDMVLYWDVPLDDREECVLADDSILAWSKGQYAEAYFSTNFLNKIGHPIGWTLADSWDVYSRYFCVIDRESVDLFWLKYNWEDGGRWRSSSHIRTSAELTFRDWLNLHSGAPTRYAPPEAVLAEKFDAIIAP